MLQEKKLTLVGLLLYFKQFLTKLWPTDVTQSLLFIRYQPIHEHPNAFIEHIPSFAIVVNSHFCFTINF